MAEQLERDTERVGELETVGSKGSGDDIGSHVTCNGGIVRTLELPKNGVGSSSRSIKDSFDSAVSKPLDVRWRGEEEAVTDLNCKDLSHKSHTSDNSSSDDGDESEGGAFAANWYVPLPQDPQGSDYEGTMGEGEWSEGAAGSLQEPQDEDEQSLSTGASLKEIKPTSEMEHSQVEAIKLAMAGFSLPPGSRPQWAQVVPEDVWKAELIGGLQQTHRHKSKSKTKQKKL